MKIKSITNVITNSSSEVFLIRTYGKTPQQILKELEAHDNGQASGMGGDISVYNSKLPRKAIYGEGSWYYSLDPDFAIIDIDHAKRDTIEWILANYFVIAEDTTVGVVDPSNQRVIAISKWGNDNLRHADPYPDEWIKDTYPIIDSLLTDEYIMKEKQEMDTDMDKYSQKVQDWYYRMYEIPQFYSDILRKYPSAEDYIEYREKVISDWIAEHPKPIMEKYKYEY